jgi:hypothetical protein
MKKQFIDWTQYMDSVEHQQEVQAFIDMMEKLTGRQMYTMDTYSLLPQYIVDRPVKYALHGTILNYDIDPIEIMTYCLVDGVAYLRVEGADTIYVDEYVKDANWNPISDTLDYVVRKWVYEDEASDMELWHIETYTLMPDGTCLYTEYEPSESDEDLDNLRVAYQDYLPYFPYVGIPWKNYQSFIETYSGNIIRQEAAYRVIATENIERMGLQLYITNMRKGDTIEQAPRKFGRKVYMLPKDADFKSPNPDGPGMELMVEELDRLDRALEKASGVVSTERLASLSGVSRQIAERPLIILASEIRTRFIEGMEAVVEKIRVLDGSAEDFKASFQPLTLVEDTDKYLRVIDKAKEVDAITPEEEIRELRQLLNLTNKPL